MLMTIFKFLAMWTLVSFAAALIIGPALKRLRQEPANHLMPLPQGSIQHNHPERES